MSYILDALKKAEHERDLGRVPRLESVQDNAPRRRGALWLVAGALLVNAVVLAWWLRPNSRQEAVHRAQAPSSSPAMPSQQAAATPATARPATVASAPSVPPAAVAARIPDVTRAPAAIQPEPVPISRPAPLVAKSPVTPPEPVARESVAPAPPLLRDMSAEFRAAVPPLSLDVHVYAPSVSGRFVLINMKKYHEGDQLAEGPYIEEITDDGVILSYQGERFRIARP